MSKLSNRLFAARDDMRKQRRILARARRLYVQICRKAISEDRTGDILEFCAGRMLESGMYAECMPRKSALQNVRYSILRSMWRSEVGPGPGYSRKPSWHEWALMNGWAFHTWRRIKLAA